MLFTDIEKSLQMHMETFKFQTAREIPNIKSHVGNITIPDFKLYY